MNIQKTIEDTHEAKLVVELDAETTEKYKRRAARKISERGKIPGFRPGKAPYHMVVLNYGEQTILEAAIDMFVDDEYPNILKEAEIEPGDAGTLEAIDSFDPVRLTFRVPLAPQVDLGDYHSIRLPYEWTPPSQEKVDEALKELREMYATTENVEREAQEGDYLLVSIQSQTSELNDESFATLIRAEDRNTEWPYPGFARELIGMKPGDTRTIRHTFPEDWDVEDLRGKEVEMQVTLKTVRAVTLPELNDDFAKTVGAGETLAELTEKVRQDVEARYQAEYDQQYFKQLVDKIKENASIKYHRRALEHEAEHVLNDLNARLARQGIDLDTYFKVRNITREKFMEEEAIPLAQKHLERSLILDEIVRLEKLTDDIDGDELSAELQNVVNELVNDGVDIQKLGKGKKGERLAEAISMETFSRLLTRQTFNLLKSIATGEYKSPEERAAAQATQAAQDTQDVQDVQNASSEESKPEQTESAVPMNDASGASEGSSEAER